MTYDASENSTYDGMPVELYLFENGTIEKFGYTNSETPITHLGVEFLPVPVSRDDISDSPNIERQELNVYLPLDAAIGALWKTRKPASTITTKVFGFHRNDVDGEFVIKWPGRVIDANFSGPELTVRNESILTSLKRTGVGRRWQIGCPYVLYSDDCGVDRTDYELIMTATEINGAILTIPALNNGNGKYMTGGYVTWVNNDNGVIERRFIEEHNGELLTLDGAVFNLSTDIQDIKLYPGCTKTPQHCRLFDNFDNFGGALSIPGESQNPFNGNPVY